MIHSEVAHKSSTYVLHIGQVIGQLRRQLASIIAMDGGHDEQLNTVFNISSLQCNDKDESFWKLSDYSIHKAHMHWLTTAF